jgi:hypothetical protein
MVANKGSLYRLSFPFPSAAKGTPQFRGTILLRGDLMQEQYEARLKELKAQLQQAQIRYQQAHDDMLAISGAIQEVTYWINRLKEGEKE